MGFHRSGGERGWSRKRLLPLRVLSDPCQHFAEAVFLSMASLVVFVVSVTVTVTCSGTVLSLLQFRLEREHRMCLALQHGSKHLSKRC